MRTRNSIWAVTIIIVASITGIVALAAVSNGDEEKLLPLLIGLIAPTIASLIAAEKADANNATLSRIDGRLNGELDNRIATAVTQALHEYHAARKEDCENGDCR